MKLLSIPISSKDNQATREAPERIVNQLMQHLFLNEAGRDTNYQILSVPGNNHDSHNDVETDTETQKNIMTVVSEMQEKAIILGGDHLVTYYSMKGFLKNHAGAGMVVFDAYPNAAMNATNKEYRQYSQDSLSHKNFLAFLIHEDLVSPDRIILVGNRNWTENEKQLLEKHKIRVYAMRDIYDIGTEEACDTIMEIVREWPSIYLSINMNVVDPAFAPGISYPEPGGLSSREMLYFCQRIKLLKNVSIIDILGINSLQDINDVTIKLAAKLVKELS